MFNPITEMFLTEYYLLGATFSQFFNTKEQCFFKFGKAFGISDDVLKKLHCYAEDASVKRIASEKEYFRHIRIKKYLSMTDGDKSFDENIEQIITIKGNAITQALNAGVCRGGDSTATSICNGLLARVAQGNVLAMRMCAIAYLEGIAFDANRDEGIRLLEGSASWWDISSIVLLRSYDPQNDFGSIGHLATVVQGTPYKNLVDNKCSKKKEFKYSDIDRLIEKAFKVGTLQREFYIPQYARVLFNEHIAIREKEQIVLTLGKDQVMNVSNLPLEPIYEGKIEFDFSMLDINDTRTEERSQIRHNLMNSDLRRYEGYRTLCIASDSLSVLQMYAQTIAPNCEKVNTVCIDMAEHSDQEFDMTLDNLFVKNCKEDMKNIYLIFCYGDVTDKAMECLRSFVQSNARTSFRLKYPGITLDLGSVLPICFCDKRHSKNLRDVCELISVLPMNIDEIRQEIVKFLETRREMYGIVDISIDEQLIATMAKMDIDQIKNILDRAIIRQRYGNSEIVLSYENVAEFMKNFKNNFTYGFGGTTNA